MLIACRNGMGSSKKMGTYWGLCLTAEEAGSTIQMEKAGSAPDVSLLYSTDAATWNEFVVGTTVVMLSNVDDKVWFKAGPNGNERLGLGDNIYNYFVMTGRIAGSGSILSLLDEHEDAILSLESSRNYTFIGLFRNCVALDSFEYDDFPSIPINAQAAYRALFENTSLKIAPRLDATVVARQCYEDIFRYCYHLTALPPQLPATNVAQNCYTDMFTSCTSLSSAEGMVLSSTGASKIGSYEKMFYNCTSLTSAPFMRDTSVTARYSYKTLFGGCSSLAQISVSFTAWPTNNACDDWVNGVAPSGTFYCPTALGTNETIARGTNRCPDNWTVVNTDAT